MDDLRAEVTRGQGSAGAHGRRDSAVGRGHRNGVQTGYLAGQYEARAQREECDVASRLIARVVNVNKLIVQLA